LHLSTVSRKVKETEAWIELKTLHDKEECENDERWDGTHVLLLVVWGRQALQVRRAQDLNLVMKKSYISHGLVKHRCCICLHMQFRSTLKISIQSTPFQFTKLQFWKHSPCRREKQAVVTLRFFPRASPSSDIPNNSLNYMKLWQ